MEKKQGAFFYSEESRNSVNTGNVRFQDKRRFAMRQEWKKKGGKNRRNSINIDHEEMKEFYHQQKSEKTEENGRKQEEQYKYSKG